MNTAVPNDTADDDSEQTTPASVEDDTLDQATRIELLEAENRQLRAEYARARQSTYRRTALALAVLGFVSLVGGFVFPIALEVFVVLGAIGLFGAVLTYYLTPGQFVAADVGERVYTAGARNMAGLVRDLELQDQRIYLPGGNAGSARLFVPLYVEYELPVDERGVLVLDDDKRGVVLEPTGGMLFQEFERTLSSPLADEPGPLAAQLCDGLVEQFELANRATPDIDATGTQITIAISASTFGEIDRFDHPVPSFLATGVAVGLDRPVTVEVSVGDDRADWLVSCRIERSSASNQ